MMIWYGSQHRVNTDSRITSITTTCHKILVKVLRQDKGCIAENEVFSSQTMAVFRTGPTAAEGWRNGFGREEVRRRQKTHVSEKVGHFYFSITSVKVEQF